MTALEPLGPDALRRSCDLDVLGLTGTADLEPLGGLVGQDRAEEAIELSLGIRQREYNLFVLGPPGAGKHTLVRSILDEHAARGDVPDDWCYVHGFVRAREPRALRLPPGRGSELRDAMVSFVDELGASLPAAFETDEYRARAEQLASELQDRQEKVFSDLGEKAEAQGLRLLPTPVGLTFAPIKESEVMSPDEFSALPDEEKKDLREKLARLEKELQQLLSQVPIWAREARAKKHTLDQEVAGGAVEQAMTPVRERFADLEPVLTWLDLAREDVVEHYQAFLPPDSKEEVALERMMGEAGNGFEPKRRYGVNVIVDHADQKGAPVVYEDHPIVDHLVGRLEYRAEMGALVTDFNLIAGGALHLANGGYLVLDARKLLSQPYAWEALKRAVLGGEVRVEPLGRTLGLVSTISLEPEPIPLDVKVVLIGERRLYYLLCAHDPDFCRLFKIAADFEDDVVRDETRCHEFARMLRSLVDRGSLRQLTGPGVAAMIEHAAREAGDAGRIALDVQDLDAVLHEANVLAERSGDEQVDRTHVDAAIEARFRRGSRLRERGLAAVDDGVILISTEGKRVGQINGLSVLSLGGVRWGRPARITARVRLGKGEVVDIEREVDLGGALHSKGVLILSGFLGARFAVDRPLGLSASLVFEQSYGGVDGDSASMAEACVLMSAIGDVPLRQDLAITGSMNQLGDAQAIGGVNEKIEGFFDTCVHAGLTGTQGVIIPASNVRHLMLAPRVVEAVRDGKFAIYPVRHVDEALALLSSLEAGTRREDATDEQEVYGGGTFNGLVEARLRKMADRIRELAEPRKTEGAPAKEPGPQGSSVS